MQHKILVLAVAAALASASAAKAANDLLTPTSAVTDSSVPVPPPPGMPAPPVGPGAPLGMPVDANVIATHGAPPSQDIYASAVYGPGSYAQSALFATALGAAASVRDSNYGVALGSGSIWHADSSIAINASGGGVSYSASSIAMGYSAGVTGIDQTVYANSVAMGTSARVESGASQAMAFGYGALVQGLGFYNPDMSLRAPILDGIAFGTGAAVLGDSAGSIAFGANARVTDAANSVAIGSNTGTNESNVIAFGFRRLTQVSDGQQTTDAASYGQLLTLQSQVASLGGGGGGGLSSAGGFTALDPGAYFSVTNSAYQGITVYDGGVYISSDLDMGGNRISHVADGVAQDDVATVGQLQREVATGVATAMESALTPMSARVTAVEQSVAALETKMSGGIAAATALAQPVSFGEGHKQAVTGGVATFNGQHAIALAYNRIIDVGGNRRLMLSAGGSITSDRQSVARAGGSFSW